MDNWTDLSSVVMGGQNGSRVADKTIRVCERVSDIGGVLNHGHGWGVSVVGLQPLDHAVNSRAQAEKLLKRAAEVNDGEVGIHVLESKVAVLELWKRFVPIRAIVIGLLGSDGDVDCGSHDVM